MADPNTVRLTLEGDVYIADLAKALNSFSALLRSLSKEIASNSPIEWLISDLDAGSAEITATGRGPDLGAVQLAVIAFDDVGAAMERNEVIARGAAVRRAADELTKLVDGHIKSVVFEARGNQHIVKQVETDEVESPHYALGSITGTVQTLKSRGALSFVLYDDIFDRPIRCSVPEERREEVRDIWEKRVTVTGLIMRNTATGHAIRMPRVERIEILPSGEQDDWEGMEGLWKAAARPSEKPENLIRRMRDAG